MLSPRAWQLGLSALITEGTDDPVSQPLRIDTVRILYAAAASHADGGDHWFLLECFLYIILFSQKHSRERLPDISVSYQGESDFIHGFTPGILCVIT